MGFTVLKVGCRKAALPPKALGENLYLVLPASVVASIPGLVASSLQALTVPPSFCLPFPA
jgi:type III secretory pathway component EscS